LRLSLPLRANHTNPRTGVDQPKTCIIKHENLKNHSSASPETRCATWFASSAPALSSALSEMIKQFRHVTIPGAIIRPCAGGKGGVP
jgi:hypothetical protein